MKPRLLQLHIQTRRKLINLKKKSEEEGKYRIAKRIHAVLLNSEGKTSIEIAKLLHVDKSSVSEWLRKYEKAGHELLLEGLHSGRPPKLTEENQIKLCQIIDDGPIGYGFSSAIWTSIMIKTVIEKEFLISYHQGHVRKLLKELNYSIQRPKRVLARADEKKKAYWKKRTYPTVKKKLVQ